MRFLLILLYLMAKSVGLGFLDDQVGASEVVV